MALGCWGHAVASQPQHPHGCGGDRGAEALGWVRTPCPTGACERIQPCAGRDQASSLQIRLAELRAQLWGYLVVAGEAPEPQPCGDARGYIPQPRTSVGHAAPTEPCGRTQHHDAWLRGQTALSTGITQRGHVPPAPPLLPAPQNTPPEPSTLLRQPQALRLLPPRPTTQFSTSMQKFLLPWHPLRDGHGGGGTGSHLACPSVRPSTRPSVPQQPRSGR